MLAWDDASTELKNVCEHCCDEFLVAGFARKFDIHKISEKLLIHESNFSYSCIMNKTKGD